MRYLLASVAVLISLGSGLAAGAERDVQDFVYLGDKAPLLIRFHVRIDGKPLLDVWEEFVGKVFDYVDVNGDGVLSKDEADSVASLPVLFNNGPGIAKQGQGIGEEIDKNKDGKITREELAAWFRQRGAGPFQFGTNRPQQNQKVFLLGGPVQPVSADTLNKKLFRLLDANQDGKLSRQELSRAPVVFQKLDADDDEQVSAQEMNGDAPSNVEAPIVVATTFTDTAKNNSPFIMVLPDQANRKQLAGQILKRYGPRDEEPSAQKLTREDIGLDEATFTSLDADRDGSLDGDELSRFTQRAPDLEFRVRLGKKTGSESAVERITPKGRPSLLAPSVRPGSGGTLLLEFGTTQIELGLGGEPAGMIAVAAVKQSYLDNFRMADTDKNGYLDAKEAEQSSVFKNRILFQAMDRDGDGKLFEKEIKVYQEKTKKLQEAAKRSCASLAFQDQGRGLFDMADANGDGRLSVREMRQMVRLVDQLDRDGDAQIRSGEVPHKYRLDVKQGPARGNSFGSGVVVLSKTGAMEPEPPRRIAGPRWFRKMDRNHDGDVSRREFLGTEDAFRRIDTDGDGLLSVEEAERADKLFRKAKNAKP